MPFNLLNHTHSLIDLFSKRINNHMKCILHSTRCQALSWVLQWLQHEQNQQNLYTCIANIPVREHRQRVQVNSMLDGNKCSDYVICSAF